MNLILELMGMEAVGERINLLQEHTNKFSSRLCEFLSNLIENQVSCK
jgi:hypothetical protein